MFTYVKVFGERNSGTIYLTGLIRENTNAIILEGDTRGKGGSLNGQNVLFKGAYTGDNDYLQDLDHFRILQSDFGWKHAAPPTDVMNFSLHGYLTKFIFTAKHPCFWLQSIFKRPYNPRLSSIGSFSEFIRSPWPVSRRDNIGSESVLETPIDLFNRKVTSYIECLDKFPENSAFVKYEDLLHDTQGSVERVCNGVLGAGTIPFKNLMRSTKSADENFDFYKKKYTSRDYLDQISKEDLTFIGSKLSARVLDFCGYKVEA
jgi:hypothetical protein